VTDTPRWLRVREAARVLNVSRDNRDPLRDPGGPPGGELVEGILGSRRAAVLG